MSRVQALRCTRREIAYLQFWRRQGVMIRVDEPIPLNTMTPPSFDTRHPFRAAMIGAAIVIFCLGCMGFWLGKAAGIL